MKLTLHNILHNCSEASKLSLIQHEQPLDLRQKIFLRLHLLYCKCCRNFEVISSVIDHSLAQRFESLSKYPPYAPTDEWKDKLKKSLKSLDE